MVKVHVHRLLKLLSEMLIEMKVMKVAVEISPSIFGNTRPISVKRGKEKDENIVRLMK